MKLFSQDRQQQSSRERSDEQLRQLTELHQYLSGQLSFFHTASLALLSYLKGLTIGLLDIGADEFHTRLDGLHTLFTSPHALTVLRSGFAKQQGHILEFIKRKRVYLDEREAELSNIIVLLDSGLHELYGTSQLFSEQMHKRNLQLERINKLDDLRRLKTELTAEVEQMKEAIEAKRTADQQRTAQLSREAQLLQRNLSTISTAEMWDPLTGALNRPAFENHLQRLLNQHQRSYTPFCLLLCDIDSLSSINDRYGVEVGDRLLASFVRSCKAFFRVHDVIARYHGQQFAVVLPHTILALALRRARRLCRSLPHAQLLVDPEWLDTEKISITLSIGVCEANRQDVMETLLLRADSTLQLAKQQGKNRVVSEDELKQELRKGRSITSLRFHA